MISKACFSSFIFIFIFYSKITKRKKKRKKPFSSLKISISLSDSVSCTRFLFATFFVIINKSLNKNNLISSVSSVISNK